MAARRTKKRLTAIIYVPRGCVVEERDIKKIQFALSPKYAVVIRKRSFKVGRNSIGQIALILPDWGSFVGVDEIKRGLVLAKK